MNSQSYNNISIKEANKLLNNGLPLTNANVEGNLKNITIGSWNKNITIENYIIEGFDCSVTQFEKPVRFINTHFKNCRFVFSCFLQGLIIDNCTFEKYLDFKSGGHNTSGFPIIIRNNIFSGFVNFFNCWYKGEFTVRNNKFVRGTNIESKSQLIKFDVTPVIIDNIGKTDVEAEFGS